MRVKINREFCFIIKNDYKSVILYIYVITGPFCDEMGIDHVVVNEPFPEELPSSPPTNGVLLELEDSVVDTFHVIQTLWPKLFVDLCAYKSYVGKMRVCLKKVKKSKRGDKVQEFKQKLVLTTDSGDRPCKLNPKPVKLIPEPVDAPEVIELKIIMKELNETKSKLQMKDNFLNEYQMKAETMSEMYEECSNRLVVIQKDLVEAERNLKGKEEDIVKLTVVNSNLHANTKKLGAEIKDIKCGSLYKRLSRRSKYISAKESKIKDKMTTNGPVVCTKCNKEIQLKKEKKSVETMLSAARTKSKLYLSNCTQLRKKLKVMTNECVVLKAELGIAMSHDDFTTHTDSPGQPFVNSLEKCVMELVGELDVPTNKCSQVIQTVGKWLFDKKIPLNQLPSASTANSMVDRAHVLSKFQVAEEIISSEKWDLHGDGTSRDHQKILGNQVTLDTGKTLSVGFVSVATEDSSTLLDNSIAMMDELSDIYSDSNEKEMVYKEIL